MQTLGSCVSWCESEIRCAWGCLQKAGEEDGNHPDFFLGGKLQRQDRGDGNRDDEEVVEDADGGGDDSQ